MVYNLKNILAELKTKTLNEVANDMGMSRWALRRLITRLQKNDSREQEVKEIDEPRMKVNSIPRNLDEAMLIWADMIGFEPVKDAKKKISQNKGNQKKLLLNDIHAPYHSVEHIKAIVKEHSKDTDVLILGGDVLDCYAFSRYPKFFQDYSMSEELRIGKAFINYLSDNFKQIKVISGNHEARVIKWLVNSKNFSPSEAEAIRLLAKIAISDDSLDIFDPLNALTRDLKNVELVPPVVKDGVPYSFFMQEGDAIISHAERFSKTPMGAGNSALKWFRDCAIPMGLVKPFTCIFQTHTHAAGWVYGDGGVFVYECGNLALTASYSNNPNLGGAGRPSCKAYTLIYQNEGITDLKETRVVPVL